MGKKLFFKVCLFYPIFICLFLFLPAGSFNYWEAWVYAFTLFIPMMIVLSYLSINDPALLERRLKFREKEREQRKIVRFSRLPLILCFLIPGLDHRFGWSEVSILLVVAANVMVLLGYLLVFLVFRENTYTSRIVEVEKGQRVISTGPYAFVRHPMYLGTILMYLFTSIALGSWWGLVLFVFMPIVLVARIFSEERLLLKELPGYREYCQKVRYRLIPYAW